MSSLENTLEAHGWTAVDRDPKVLFSERAYHNEPHPLSIDEIHFPSEDNLVVKLQDYAREKLSLPTYHHSMRVFYFGESHKFRRILSTMQALTTQTF